MQVKGQSSKWLIMTEDMSEWLSIRLAHARKCVQSPMDVTLQDKRPTDTPLQVETKEKQK